MTTDKDFKDRVRQRMAKTGESYTAARSHIVSQNLHSDNSGIRTIHEASGRWAARTDSYPHLVAYGATSDEAQQRLSAMVRQCELDYESDWRDQLDDYNIDYIELQDD